MIKMGQMASRSGFGDVLQKNRVIHPNYWYSPDIIIEQRLLLIKPVFDLILFSDAIIIHVMTRDEDIARRAADYITTNLCNDLNHPTISVEFQISQFTLQRIFRQTYGQTVHQFILEEKLDKANVLLTTTHDPVKAVMSEVGFKSSSTFTRTFHKKFKISPAALRDGD
jgi:AraC-like DNA-binding protein